MAQQQSQSNSLPQTYIPNISLYSEILTAGKTIQPDWEILFSSLIKTRTEEIENRNSDILRLLKENGVSLERIVADVKQILSV